MRYGILATLLFAACSTAPRKADPAPDPLPPEVKEQEKGLAIERGTTRFSDKRPVPKITEQERRDFVPIWELYRKGDPRWPAERDRFRGRSEGAAFLVTAHILRHYQQVNTRRQEFPKELDGVCREVVAVGEPCVPYLVDWMILDFIPLPDGSRYFPDDLTRKDCSTMLERIGAPALPALLAALSRKDVGEKGRRLLALTLGGTRDGRALQPLLGLLRKDESWQVRADAASGLAKLGDRKAIPALEQSIQSDPDPAVVRRAGKARYELMRGGTR